MNNELLSEEQNRLIELEFLQDLSNTFYQKTSLTELIPEILQKTMSMVNAKSGVFLKPHPRSGLFVAQYCIGFDQVILSKTLLTRRTVFIKDSITEKRTITVGEISDERLKKTFSAKHLIITPIFADGSDLLHGVLILGDKETRNDVTFFNRDDARRLNQLSRTAAIALQNAWLISEVETINKQKRLIFQHMPIALMAIDALGEVFFVNEAFEELLGKSWPDIHGHPYEIVLKDHSLLKNIIWRGTKSGKPVIHEKIPFEGKHKKLLKIRQIPFSTDPTIHQGMLLLIEDETKEHFIKTLFKRYMSDEIVESLLKDDKKLSLGGQKKMVTVLFSDIRGFTSISEQLPAENVVETLNDYYTRMIRVIFRFNGTIDKIVGDSLMVVFGVPFEKDDDTLRAAHTAIAMIWELRQFNEERRAKGEHELHMGIGINKGMVISGNIGAPERMDFTVIGDAVNVAARLCGVASKDEIIISENVGQLLEKHMDLEKRQPIQVKGKLEPIQTYKINW